MINPYDTLGVSVYATEEEIKQAWRRLCRKWHPDRNKGDATKMTAINEAYNALMDSEWRARFDQTGDGSPPLTIDAEARNAIMQFIVSVLMMENEMPLYESVLQMIETNIAAQEMTLHRTERKFKKIERQMKTLKLTEVGKGHFGDLIIQMGAALNDEKAKAQRLIDALKRAHDMFKEVASKAKDGNEALSFFQAQSGVYK